MDITVHHLVDYRMVGDTVLKDRYIVEKKRYFLNAGK